LNCSIAIAGIERRRPLLGDEAQEEGRVDLHQLFGLQATRARITHH
jgi:hypothetical protein